MCVSISTLDMDINIDVDIDINDIGISILLVRYGVLFIYIYFFSMNQVFLGRIKAVSLCTLRRVGKVPPTHSEDSLLI